MVDRDAGGVTTHILLILPPLRLILALGLLAIELVLVVWGMQPPTPLPADAPADEFSAGRAFDVLQTLLAEEVPHPVGSTANTRIRERIIAHLEQLGYGVEVQEATACNRRGRCEPVKNVLARLPGRQAGPAVMLAAHYDGVPAGPAVADDGAGVAAILEIARILKREGPFRNPVILLLDDGEEAGLLGAQAFVAEHPWADSIGAIINLEARGTSGASLMFETSEDNAWLIDTYARSVPRPNTSSLFFEAYRRLPNDTDFSVFKRAGMQGLNFAFIDEVENYHTPRDDLENLDRGSLQHHGDNALGLARSLAAMELRNPPPGNAVYNDLFGLVVLRWPEGATLPLAVAALLLLIVATARMGRSGEVSGRALAWGMFEWLLILVGAVLLGLLLDSVLAVFTGANGFWGRDPLPMRILLWAAVLIVGATAATTFARWVGFWGSLLGGWLLWAGIAVVLAATIPGASVVFLVPAGIAALALIAVCLTPLRRSAAAVQGAVILGSLAAGMIWLKLALGLEMTFGVGASPVITLPLALVMATLAPLFAAPPEARPSLHPRSA